MVGAGAEFPPCAFPSLCEPSEPELPSRESESFGQSRLMTTVHHSCELTTRPCWGIDGPVADIFNRGSERKFYEVNDERSFVYQVCFDMFWSDLIKFWWWDEEIWLDSKFKPSRDIPQWLCFMHSIWVSTLRLQRATPRSITIRPSLPPFL